MHELTILSEFVAISSTLTHLELSDNNTGESVTRATRFAEHVVVKPCPGLAALCEALFVNTSCISLNLSNNNIDSTGAWLLSTALKNPNFKILKLSIGGNPFGRAGGVEFAESFRVNTSITHLSLKGTPEFRLVCPVVKAVAKSLAKYNDTIVSVDLSGNLVEDEVALALAAALKRDLRYRSSECVLQELRVSDSNITGQGLIIMARALDGNQTLQTLDVANNLQVDDHALAMTFKELRGNTILASLDITGMTLGAISGSALGDLLSSNTSLSSVKVGPQGFGIWDQYEDSTHSKQSLGLSDLARGLTVTAAGGSAGSSALSELNLRGLHGADLGLIMEQLPSQQALTKLDMGGHVWENGSWNDLCSSLPHIRQVNTLSLSYSVLAGDRGMYDSVLGLIQAVNVSPYLTELDLSGIALGANGCYALAEGLSGANGTRNSNLKKLVLNSCALGAIESTSLPNTPRQGGGNGNKLQQGTGGVEQESGAVEDESSTGVEGNGLTMFLGALVEHESLETLSLQDNGFQEDFYVSLCALVAQNRQLLSLNLRDNEVAYSETACRHIGSLLACSKSLTKLWLPSVYLGDEGEPCVPSDYNPNLCMYCGVNIAEKSANNSVWPTGREGERGSGDNGYQTLNSRGLEIKDVNEENDLDLDEFCPATFKLPHNYVNGICTACAYIEGNNPYNQLV